jgi:hypothetical protein
MSKHLERVSAMSWIAITALGVLVATAPLTLPANYKFLLSLIIYIVILRQIWFFVRSKAKLEKLVWVLLGLLMIHNPLIASYLKSTQFWVMILVYTGVVLLYLELRLILAQDKTPSQDS